MVVRLTTGFSTRYKSLSFSGSQDVHVYPGMRGREGGAFSSQSGTKCNHWLHSRE